MADPAFLFGVGAQKAGTTWLYKYLRDHPEVHVPQVKEMHYFDARWIEDGQKFENSRRQLLKRKQEHHARRNDNGWRISPELDAAIQRARALVAMYDAPQGDHSVYRDFMLSEHGEERYVADITPSYSLLKAKHFQEMSEAFAPAKFLFILRDPVQRMWSQIRMQSAAAAEKRKSPVSPQDIIEGLVRGEYPGIWTRSCMDVTLGALRDLPNGTLKVMFYETMFQDAQIEKLCNFLEIDFIPGSYSERINAGQAAEMTRAQHATLRWLNAPIYRAIYDAMGDEIPSSWDMTALTAARPAHLPVSEIHDQFLQGRTT